MVIPRGMVCLLFVEVAEGLLKQTDGGLRGRRRFDWLGKDVQIHCSENPLIYRRCRCLKGRCRKNSGSTAQIHSGTLFER